MDELQFQQKLKRLLSSNYSLDEKQVLKTQIESVSKQQYLKIKKQKREKRQLQDRIYFLKNSYRNKIKKYNANLCIIKKLLQQNNNIAIQLIQYPKIKEKVNIIGLIKNKMLDLKKILLFEQDIDQQNLQKTIKDNR